MAAAGGEGAQAGGKKQKGDDERRARRQAAGREGAAGRACHAAVELPLLHLVQRRGAAGEEKDAESRPQRANRPATAATPAGEGGNGNHRRQAGTKKGEDRQRSLVVRYKKNSGITQKDLPDNHFEPGSPSAQLLSQIAAFDVEADHPLGQ